MIEHEKQFPTEAPLPLLRGTQRNTWLVAKKPRSTFVLDRRKKACLCIGIAMVCLPILLFSSGVVVIGTMPSMINHNIATVSWTGFTSGYLFGLLFLVQSKAVNEWKWIAGLFGALLLLFAMILATVIFVSGPLRFVIAYFAVPVIVIVTTTALVESRHNKP